MKTLRFIGMALIAIIMSVNFAACSDDDENNPNGNPEEVTGKRLIQDMESEDPNDISYYHYAVDGWLEKVVRSSEDRDEDIYCSYSKQNDDTYITETWGDGKVWNRFMFNDFIRSINGKDCIYDSEGHLIQCGDIKFTWENDNIIRSEDEYDITTYTYYTDKENKRPINTDPIIDCFESFFLMAHPHLLGKYSKNLVKSAWIREGHSWTYSYKCDADGYVLSYKCEDDEYNSFDYKWK